MRRRWDAIIDVNGQRPAQLERSVALDAGWYLFISTLNAYADLSRPGIEEDSPTIVEFDPTDEAQAYGGNKAACERIVRERFGERTTIVRPGLIVGAWDYTGRFSYWPQRALRGGRFIVPGPEFRAVQFVDVRDLAAFAALAITREIGGAYNVVGPAAPFSLEGVGRVCVAAAAERGIASEAVPIRSEVLLDAGVQPWIDIPMWLEDPQYAALFEVSCGKAVAAGLEHHSPLETIRALMDWLSRQDSAIAASPGLSTEREAALLQEFAR